MFDKLIKRLCKQTWFEKSNWLRTWLLIRQSKPPTLPYYQNRHNLDALFFDYFKTAPTVLSQSKKEIWVTDRREFQRRLSVFSGGLLDGLDLTNVVLGGGSVVNLLNKTCDLESSNSDLDLFVLCNSSFMTTLQTTIRHFEHFATNKGVTIHYIIRGVLIEVLIPHQKRIQIICTRSKTAKDCLYYVDLGYVQVYYDNSSVWASHHAMRSIVNGTTNAIRAPLKKSRIEKARSKGFGITPPFIFTELDEAYCHLLHRIDVLKEHIDTLPNSHLQCEGIVIYYNASDCIHGIRAQIKYRWDLLRWLHHSFLMVTRDLDIFDQNMRVFSYNNQQELVLTLHDTIGGGFSVIGHAVDKDFLSIVFLSGELTLVSFDTVKGVISIQKNEELSVFIDKICEQLDVEYYSNTGTGTGTGLAPVYLQLHQDGSRVYNTAELPFSLNDVTLPVQCDLSFICKVTLGQLSFEVVDLYVHQHWVSRSNSANSLCESI